MAHPDQDVPTDVQQSVGLGPDNVIVMHGEVTDRLRSTVTLTDPASGEVVTYQPGEQVPPRILRLLPEHHFLTEDELRDTAPAEAGEV